HDNNGPQVVKLSTSAVPPTAWHAEAEVPTWWKIEGGKKAQSFHWCFAAGNAERHHGWFFLYNPESSRAWCWHWNHQWSSNECPSS
ncbi:MAG: hypothetical protein K8R88_05915, partial [Armatimonadetes bacterium]|nr:hypothetical protein [Armatimonadota bacterium]